jgi:hypothetical protein
MRLAEAYRLNRSDLDAFLVKRTVVKPPQLAGMVLGVRQQVLFYFLAISYSLWDGFIVRHGAKYGRPLGQSKS